MNKHLNKMAQKGFTLIELIITIVIIGVLAAVAIPKFQSLSTEAEIGVAKGIAGAGASASSVRYAQYKAGTQAAVTTCFGLVALVDMPTGYSFDGTTGTNGATAQCEVKKGTAADAAAAAALPSFSTPVYFQAYGN